MKTRNKIILLLALALTCMITSCESYLDTMPDQRTELNSVRKVKDLLMSAYSTASSIQMEEFMSDNRMDNGEKYGFPSNILMQGYYWEEMTDINQDTPRYLWNGCYSAIAAANQALQAIEELGDPEEAQPYKGEALMCRAYGHFALAKIFCMAYGDDADTNLGIPYITAPETNVGVQYERGTLAETYAMIDKDIEEIKLTNVGYSFKDKEVFKNINCSFEKGKNYAIVGESGSGKSTLINIILGNNKQYSGSVKYNDVEISDIEESQLFKSVSYIGNITHIYHDSLRNNLTLWDNKINESEIINILKQVNLIDLIPRLDDEVSMSFLSEGQKQRLGIARAYLTKTNVIIMDESMANLDRDNAFLIENQLLNDPTRMYITVSHHLQEKLLDRFHSIITL